MIVSVVANIWVVARMGELCLPELTFIYYHSSV